MWSNWKAWWRQADRRRSPDIPNPQPVPLQPEAGPVEIQRPPLADGGTPEVFEPALRHCNRAFRAGDPVFSDDSTQRVWQLARRSAIDHVLQIVERSQWNQHLVLRGSILLQAWFGDEAREPGDIDWIYRPQSEAMDSPRATQMFQELRAEVGQNPSAGLATFLPDQLVESEIGRTSGLRESGWFFRGELPMAFAVPSRLMSSSVKNYGRIPFKRRFRARMASRQSSGPLIGNSHWPQRSSGWRPTHILRVRICSTPPCWRTRPPFERTCCCASCDTLDSTGRHSLTQHSL